MNNIITITPEKFTFSHSKVFNNFLAILIIGILIGGFFVFRYRSTSESGHIMFGIIVPAMCFLFPFLNRFFSRFPINVQIDKANNALDVEYLNGFGNEKSDSIKLKYASVIYQRRYRFSKDMQVRVTHNLFNNWIFIDETHGFSDEQIKFIYDTLKDNQSS